MSSIKSVPSCPFIILKSNHEFPCTTSLSFNLNHKKYCPFIRNSSSRPLFLGPKFQTLNYKRMHGIASSYAKPGTSPPSKSSPKSLIGWILDILVRTFLPFVRKRILAIEEKAEGVIDTLEQAAEIAQDVAEGVNKVAEELEERLPEGSILKHGLDMVEDVAEKAAKSAHLAEELIDKVEDFEHEVESRIEVIFDQEANQKIRNEDK